MSKAKTVDLTSGPILKTLAELALPIMISSMLGTAYSIMDMAWIGLLGAKAVAGVGGEIMDFGDWPAWVALSSAIISPVVTVYLNNRHQEKMELMRQRAEIANSISIACEEILSVSYMEAKDFPGFSRNVMSASGLCGQMFTTEVFYAARSIEISAHSGKKIKDITLVLKNNRNIFYSEWAIEICGSLMEKRNEMLLTRSQKRKVRQ